MEEEITPTLGNDSSLNSFGLALERELVDAILPILTVYVKKGYDIHEILATFEMATERAKDIVLDTQEQ